jgi:hypothetical protein
MCDGQGTKKGVCGMGYRNTVGSKESKDKKQVRNRKTLGLVLRSTQQNGEYNYRIL